MLRDLCGRVISGLTAVDLRHNEEMPLQPAAQNTSHGDRLLRRQEVLTARSDAKTVAESAMEVSYVMQLSQALLEAGDIIQESTLARHRFFFCERLSAGMARSLHLSFICIPQSTRALDQGGVEPRQAVSPKALRPWTIPLRYSVGSLARHRYLAVQKDHEETKETQGESKRRATGTTRARTQAPTALPPVAAMSHEGSPELPRQVVDKVLGNLQHLPDSWPLMRFDLMLHKSGSFYAIWRRFLHLNEYLRNCLTPDTANATIDAHARELTEHLVEWILMALKPARAITKARAPDFLFLHEKDFWFKQIWVDLHQTMMLDRQGSYTRPVLGLVRCVCKDETEQTGRTSPIKMRICNLHFFATIWMAQSVVHNFRRMSMADLKPRARATRKNEWMKCCANTDLTHPVEKTRQRKPNPRGQTKSRIKERAR